MHLGIAFFVVTLSALALNPNIEAQSLAEVKQVKEVIYRAYQSDQETRDAFMRNPEDLNAKKSMQSLDELHTKTLKILLNDYKWIDASRFGSETADQAWILILHADDLEFQRKCLSQLSARERKTKAELKQQAYLHDKVAVNSGLKQRYGTQLSVGEQGNLQLKPYEGSIEEVDKRRKAAGLDPIETYLEASQSFFKNPIN